MKCPECAKKDKESEMEKAVDSDVLMCRACGHTQGSKTPREQLGELTGRVEKLEKDKTEREKKRKEGSKQDDW